MSTLLDVPIEALAARPDNLRFDANGDDLVGSVLAFGILAPLNVTAMPDGTYAINAGHRRLDACLKANDKRKGAIVTVPCLVETDDDESTHTFRMIVENLLREDLSPIEEARGYKRLIDQGGKQAEIAKLTGIGPSTISRRLSLLNLPEDVQLKVHEDKIPVKLAEAYAKLPPEMQLLAVANNWQEWQVNSSLDTVARDKRRAKLEKLAADAGLPVVEQGVVGTVTQTDEVLDRITVEVKWTEQDTDSDGNAYGEIEQTGESDVYANNGLELAAAVTKHKPDALLIAHVFDDRLDSSPGERVVLLKSRPLTADEESVRQSRFGEGAADAEAERKVAEREAKARTRAEEAHYKGWLFGLAEVPVKKAEVLDELLTHTLTKAPYYVAEKVIAAFGSDVEAYGAPYRAFIEGLSAQEQLRAAVMVMALGHSDNRAASPFGAEGAAFAKAHGFKALPKPRKTKTDEPAVEDDAEG